MTLQVFNPQKSSSLIIFDRDDTLIVDEQGIHDFERVAWLSGRIPLMQKVSNLGFEIAIATNQGAIAKGMLSIEQLEIFHSKIAAFLINKGVNLVAIAYCPHHPLGIISSIYTKECTCRKPLPGLIQEILTSGNGCYKKVFFFGDKESDIEAANNISEIQIISKLIRPRDDFYEMVNRELRLE